MGVRALLFLVLLVAFIWLGGLIALGVCAIGGVGAVLRRSRQRFERIEGFERDYPTLLVALASSVRAGLDPLVALTSAATLFPEGSLLRRELEVFTRAIESGVEEEAAIRLFGRSSGHPDVRLLQNAYLIARREGGSLGECLHRLARVTRQRQSFRRKIRGAVAMQRLSAIGIAGCAVCIGVFQWLSNPHGVGVALGDPRGVAALSAGGALMVVGLGWMAYLVRARI
jgi:Flp pilus assembly protein TadB